MNGKESANLDDIFAGRGSPALMSVKEPAIRLLKERYSESFAVVPGLNKTQIHLFLVKLGMWSLVWTFTPRDIGKEEETNPVPAFGISQVLAMIEEAMKGKDPALLEKVNKSVDAAIARIRSRTRDSGSSGTSITF